MTVPGESVDEVDPAVVARVAIETLVFAPIGLGAKIVEDAPGAIRRIRQELSNARFLGRLAVEQGAARLREQTDGADRRDAPASPELVVDQGDDLPIAGYDQLPAIEIVALLADLTPTERQAIADHETANRRRRTVLGKLAQLAE